MEDVILKVVGAAVVAGLFYLGRALVGEEKKLTEGSEWGKLKSSDTVSQKLTISIYRLVKLALYGILIVFILLLVGIPILSLIRVVPMVGIPVTILIGVIILIVYKTRSARNNNKR